VPTGVSRNTSIHGRARADYDDLASDLKRRGRTKADMQLIAMTARSPRLSGRHANRLVLNLQAHSPIMSRCRHVADEVALKFIGEMSSAALDEPGKFTIRTALPGIADGLE
jgi:hypothetical protein